MGADTKIEWCDHTFNPWRGCTKVSPGCANCYAETLSKRNPKLLGEWGKGKPRVLASDEMRRQPLRWNRMTGDITCSCTVWAGMTWEAWEDLVKLGKTGCPKCFGPRVPRRARVFCASLADVFDDEVPAEWLARLLDLIRRTPNLDWLLLSKRPENWNDRTALVASLLSRTQDPRPNPELLSWLADWKLGKAPANVWVGTTVEDQSRADQRIPHLLRIPAKVRFLSCEPMLGPVNLRAIPRRGRDGDGWIYYDDVLTGEKAHKCGGWVDKDARIHWVICGGESGPGARPMHPDWARALRDECTAAGVPFLFKQWGEWSPRPKVYGQDESFVLASDGTLYRSADIAEGGAKRQECLNAKHGLASLTSVYKVGKKHAGRMLDGRVHNEFPRVESEVAR